MKEIEGIISGWHENLAVLLETSPVFKYNSTDYSYSIDAKELSQVNYTRYNEILLDKLLLYIKNVGIAIDIDLETIEWETKNSLIQAAFGLATFLASGQGKVFYKQNPNYKGRIFELAVFVYWQNFKKRRESGVKQLTDNTDGSIKSNGQLDELHRLSQSLNFCKTLSEFESLFGSSLYFKNTAWQNIFFYRGNKRDTVLCITEKQPNKGKQAIFNEFIDNLNGEHCFVLPERGRFQYYIFPSGYYLSYPFADKGFDFRKHFKLYAINEVCFATQEIIKNGKRDEKEFYALNEILGINTEEILEFPTSEEPDNEKINSWVDAKKEAVMNRVEEFVSNMSKEIFELFLKEGIIVKQHNKSYLFHDYEDKLEPNLKAAGISYSLYAEITMQRKPKIFHGWSQKELMDLIQQRNINHLISFFEQRYIFFNTLREEGLLNQPIKPFLSVL